MKRLIFFFVAAFSCLTQAQAFEDPTGGKAFFPWLWEDQFKPTLLEAAHDKTGYGILLAGTLSTIYARSEDQRLFDHNREDRLIPGGNARVASFVGSGGPFIAVAAAQLFFDTQNGLSHGRALALTSLNHITIALLAHRERPNKSNHLSFPSGHTSSMFASATSLAYAYGPWVGVPLYGIASYVALSRVSDEAHWLSDVVAGATLGIFWGRASALAGEKSQKYIWQAIPLENGVLLQVSHNF